MRALPRKQPEAAASAVARYTAPIGASHRAEQKVVKLGIGDGGGADARQLLENASIKLERIDRSRLSSGASATYEQASTFVAAGREALARDDSAVAAGYARKASALAVKLNP